MINFNKIKKEDKEVYDQIINEYKRQNNQIELIASENVPSEAVLLAQASYHTLKYAEGYPSARYYAGCENIDQTEQLAIDRACKLFRCKFANVQPHSGTAANTAVLTALVKPGETIMGMSLNSGGHLSHGAKPSFSGQFFHSVQYDVSPETGLIDLSKLQKMLKKYKPRLLIVGASAYPRVIDFKEIRKVVDAVNVEIRAEEATESKRENKHIYILADIAHIAGLVATKLHPSPFPYVDVVTTTTHKTLRGPRGGLILWNDNTLTKKINSAVFPGIQGGPLENIIAAKAICFKEALSPSFVRYQQQILKNCSSLANTLAKRGIKLVTGGSDNHLLLLDLRGLGITGAELEKRLTEINIITNKNAIPFDERPKTITSGLRIGTPAVTSRGFKEKEMEILGNIIASVVYSTTENFEEQKPEFLKQVKKLTKKFPL